MSAKSATPDLYAVQLVKRIASPKPSNILGKERNKYTCVCTHKHTHTNRKLKELKGPQEGKNLKPNYEKSTQSSP